MCLNVLPTPKALLNLIWRVKRELFRWQSELGRHKASKSIPGVQRRRFRVTDGTSPLVDACQYFVSCYCVRVVSMTVYFFT